MKPVYLDTPFWRGFAKNIWEKKPLVLKNVKSGLLEMSAAEIFDLLVLYADRCRQQRDPEGFKFYIEGFKADADDVLQVLPQKSDKSLLGYHKRMQAEFSDYCLVCDELLQVNLKKQHLLTAFTNELYKHVGFPNRFSEMGLYLGNYRKTPFGVHVDSCGVFSFPVAGVKKFRLWPAGYGEKHPALDRAFKYGKYKKDSVVIKASPGDLVYWPSSAWHIAESDGSFSATWSLGVWVDQPSSEILLDSLKGVICKKLGASGTAATISYNNLHGPAGEVTELPKTYRQAIAVLKNLSEDELQEHFLSSWMTHISMQGFKTIPTTPIVLSAKSRIQLRNSHSLILWQQSLTKKKLFYLCFGGVQVKSSSTGLLKLIKTLNTGSTCLIGEFLKNSAVKDLTSLQALAQAGAFNHD